MAKDIQDTVRDALRALEHAGGNGRGKSGGGLSGAKGVAAGAGAAALVPLAVKGAGRLVKGIGSDGLGNVVHAPQDALHGATSKLGDRVGSSIGDKVSSKVDDAGGPSGILKDSVKSALPFGGGDDDDKQGGGGDSNVKGVGKGRRMPVQQDMDIGVNIETVYNQFTQFEDWSNFMHRVTRVTQGDEPTEVQFSAKIWTRTREFTANIETQRPNERIKWSVSQGLDITGVVTFHELGPNLTRVLLSMDLQPGGLIEKMGRGMRHVKRAARGDLHRFKAFIEMTEQETGAWRGVIEDGEVVEDHDPSYDEGREYADIDELLGEQDEDEDGDENEDEEQDEEQDEEPEEQPRQRRARSQTRAAANRSGSQSRSSSSRSGGSRSGSSRSSGSGSGSSRSGSSRSSSSRSSSSRSRNGQSGGSSRSRASASSGGQSRGRQSRSRNGHGD